MPENPLLPHKKLRELHAAMLSIRALEKKRSKRSTAREGLLAATSLQLAVGDVLCPERGDGVAATLAPAPHTKQAVTLLNPAVPLRLAMAAAVAQGQQVAATKASPTGITLAYATAGTAEPAWAAALTTAQTLQSPLLLVVTDATGGSNAKTKEAMSWATVSPVAKRLKLAVLTMDGDDAVAVYRVMQEAVIRARFGGGPAVLWAVMTANETKRSQQPVGRLETYMKVRGIAL